jgi:hypothetical protein
MSVERYSQRRHYLNGLAAQIAAMAPAPRLRVIRNTAVPRVSAAQAARLRRVRLAEAEASLAPAPQVRRPYLPASPEVCSSIMVGGSLFDASGASSYPPPRAVSQEKMRAMRKRLEIAERG